MFSEHVQVAAPIDAKLPMLLKMCCPAGWRWITHFQVTSPSATSHLCVCGMDFGRPPVVPLVWKIMATSSALTSGGAPGGAPVIGKLYSLGSLTAVWCHSTLGSSASNVSA